LGEDLYRLLTPKFETPRIQYPGKINTVEIGKTPPEGTRAYSLILGGAKDIPFFEKQAEPLRRPYIGMQVQVPPENIPNQVSTELREILDKPIEWAKFCIEECEADTIQVRFNLPGRVINEEVIKKVEELSRALVDELDVPLIFSGPDIKEIDHQILETVAKSTRGEQVLLGSARLDNDYARIAKAALDNHHVVLASTDCDPPSQKMLNDRLLDLGLSKSQIVIDPTTAALGYGLEYSLSITEQIRMNALKGDQSMQMPIAAFPLSGWTAREAAFEGPQFGKQYSRGVIWELTTALAMFLAGAELLVMLHPETVKRYRLLMGESGLDDPSTILGKTR